MAVHFPGNESNVEAAVLLREHVRESLNIAEEIVGALRLLVSHLEEFDESATWPVAHGFLATRIANDIEAASSLVLRGYFMQAQTLGASVYELSYTAAYIGNDDERAAKWMNWSDLDDLPWPRRKMVAAIRRALGDSSTHADGRYASLCWAKHGNPRFQRAGGVASSPEAHVINVDPSLGGQAHRFGEIALWLMLGPVITYLGSLHVLGEWELPTDVLEMMDNIVQLWEPFDARIWPRDSTT